MRISSSNYKKDTLVVYIYQKRSVRGVPGLGMMWTLGSALWNRFVNKTIKVKRIIRPYCTQDEWVQSMFWQCNRNGGYVHLQFMLARSITTPDKAVGSGSRTNMSVITENMSGHTRRSSPPFTATILYHLPNLNYLSRAISCTGRRDPHWHVVTCFAFWHKYTHAFGEH